MHKVVYPKNCTNFKSQAVEQGNFGAYFGGGESIKKFDPTKFVFFEYVLN